MSDSERFNKSDSVVRNRIKVLHAQKEHRLGRNIFLHELEADTGILKATWSNLMNNKTTMYHVDTIAAICDYYDCTPGDLFEYLPSREVQERRGRYHEGRDDEPDLPDAERIRAQAREAMGTAIPT